MIRKIVLILACVVGCTLVDQALGRGFGGGFRGGFGGGFGGGGGFDRGGYSGSWGRSYSSGGGSGFSSFGGADRYGGQYYGNRSFSSSSGWGGRSAFGSYDHSWSDAAGGSISTSGSRSFSEGRYGGFSASGNRDTTVTTATGKTYSADRSGGMVSGPMGRTVGGASGSVDGRYGTSNWNTAFAGNRYGNIAHYSSVDAATAHGTAYWSNGYMVTHGGYVRNGFGYYNCYQPAWYAAHPGCWLAAGWAAGAAWNAATYPAVCSYCDIPSTAEPTEYDYGSNVVVNSDNVTINGVDAGTPQQFAQQATSIADKGQTATANPSEDWKPLGVFALVQGDEKTSNNIIQLAVNSQGIIRGNYYDGLMDTTSQVYGSLDKSSQRAAWTIGKNKDRVFEAGIYNLTQSQCPCLVHLGAAKTLQMLLVRVEQPKNSNATNQQ